jgi:hypothetical protein
MTVLENYYLIACILKVSSEGKFCFEVDVDVDATENKLFAFIIFIRFARKCSF